MSSSQRKLPTTVWSRIGSVFALALLAACARTPREPFLTYFNGDYGLSVRYPAGWKTDQAEQEGIWYRYFLGPPFGPQRMPEVSVTLLAGPFTGALDDYAQTYLSGNKLLGSSDVERQQTRGRSYEFSSADGSTRYSLLLLAEKGRVYGLYSQGQSAQLDKHQATLTEMAKSLTLERPATYPIIRNDAFGFSLRVPPSWRPTRTFSAGGSLMIQYTSPALHADRKSGTVYASLSLTVEPPREQSDLDSFYNATRLKFGESFQVLSHVTWRDGYVDYMRSETSVSASRVKRFYRVSGGRGYILAFESRDDVFLKVSHWCDLIASTLRVGPEVAQP